VEQVKGVTYSLQQFLGEPTWVADFQMYIQTPEIKIQVKILLGNYNWYKKYALKIFLLSYKYFDKMGVYCIYGFHFCKLLSLPKLEYHV
jgi:hypothetical protein